jgi:hypothetical protein
VSKFSTATNHEISTHDQDDRWHKKNDLSNRVPVHQAAHTQGSLLHMQHSICVHAHAQHKEDIRTFGTEMLVGSALPPMTTTTTTTTMTTMAERRTVRSPVLLPPSSALLHSHDQYFCKLIRIGAVRLSHRQFTSEVVRKLVGCCERLRTGGVRDQSRGSLALVVDRGTARTQWKHPEPTLLPDSRRKK